MFAVIPELFGSPAPVQLGEIRLCLGGQVFGLDGPGQLDGHPDLLQVGGTVGAGAKMRLEPASTSA